MHNRSVTHPRLEAMNSWGFSWPGLREAVAIVAIALVIAVLIHSALY
jgi:hypothetical protein